MTKFEFDSAIYQEMYNEMLFLYGHDKIIAQENAGKAWYTLPEFIDHGKRFKKQLLAHCYAKRGFDFSDLCYK